ncbi:MAG: hypothetical protein KI786_09570, partial [Mameliella sp.]|nr:hypothetical protein [Phaeodactylibacter sp.]
FNTYEFGYRRITIERPLRLSSQVTDEAIESLRFAPKPFNMVMQRIYSEFGSSWNDENYGDLNQVQVEVRTLIKAEFSELKETQIKDVLNSKLWLFQKALMEKVRKLQTKLADLAGGKDKRSDDFNQFEIDYTKALKALNIKFDAKEKKQFLDVVTTKNPEAECVVDKALKGEEDSLYGAYEYEGPVRKWKGKVVSFKQDGDLRDNENVPLDPSIATADLIETYFLKEVAPHVLDAWINADKRDEKDGDIGIVGYEIPFTRHFYVYQPPRDLEEIDKDLDEVSQDILKLLREVHS